MSVTAPPDPLLVVFQTGATFTFSYLRTDEGTATGPTDYTYSGKILNLLPHGYGVQTNPRGHVYKGTWSLGKACGIGSYIYPDGRVFRGAWANGLRHGTGVNISKDGDRDVCGWIEGRRQGFGMTRWSKEGDRDGRKNTYVGGFKKDDFQGWGEKVLSEGTKYVGGFSNSKFSGFGTLKTPNGKTYEGGFRETELHGYVTITEDGDKEPKEAFYRNGQVSTPSPTIMQPIPPLTVEILIDGLVYNNGVSHTPLGGFQWQGGYYDGALDGGYPHGYGIAVFPSAGGTWYEGGWEHGLANGYGEYHLSTGEQYYGGWKDGKPHSWGWVGRVVNGVSTWTETYWKNGIQI
jgi:hypothetical protein